ncbi:hypothetical protein AA14362_1867 [Acetobacter cerevisiae DSM 14362]|nr:hypothetical protein AA14362_1867 [Acetobacter cerevisiae DSM 14362]
MGGGAQHGQRCGKGGSQPQKGAMGGGTLTHEKPRLVKKSTRLGNMPQAYR